MGETGFTLLAKGDHGGFDFDSKKQISGKTMTSISLMHLALKKSSKNELLVNLAHLYQMPPYRSMIVGLVIFGGVEINEISRQILDKSKIPCLRAGKSISVELFQTINKDVSKTIAEDQEKLDLIRSLAEKTLDFGAIDALFSL